MIAQVVTINNYLQSENVIKEYTDFINFAPSSNYFARYDYLQMISDVTKGRIILFIVKDDDNNNIIAALPAIETTGKWGKVINSLPFYGSNPGIISENSKAKYFLLNVFWEVTASYFSVTLVESAFEKDKQIYDNHFCSFIDSRISLVTHLVKDPMDIYHPKTKNLVKKASKAGVIVDFEHNNPADLKIIKIIEDIHVENMQGINVSPKPGIFFDWLEQKYQEGDKTLKVYVARYKDEIIAGLILLVHNQIAEYFMPVIKTEFRNLAPLNLVIYKAMKEMISQGVTLWNWGGTKLPGQEGVYHFKKRFGAGESIYRYFVRTNSKIMGGRYTKQAILEEYPYFYIVPFDVLSTKKEYVSTENFYDRQEAE